MTTDSATPSGHHRPERTSDLLKHFAESVITPRVTLNQIVMGLGDRGLGVLMAIFAIPNLIPSVVPFGNAAFGIPIIVFSVQLMLGEHRLYLPRFIGQRSLDTETFRVSALAIARAMAWFERLLTPRLEIFTGPVPDRVIGAICIVFAILTSLPIPFGHNLPALGLTLIGLGFIESDGLAILIGLVIGFLGLLAVGLLILGLAHGANFLAHWL
jgi:hypothetical protein